MLTIVSYWEMQTKITMMYITSHQSESLSLKNLQTMNAEEDMEKREPSYTIGGNVHGCSHHGEQYENSFKN